MFNEILATIGIMAFVSAVYCVAAYVQSARPRREQLARNWHRSQPNIPRRRYNSYMQAHRKFRKLNWK